MKNTNDLRADVMDCIMRYTDRKIEEKKNNPMDSIEWAHRAVESEVSIQTSESIALLLDGVLKQHGY